MKTIASCLPFIALLLICCQQGNHEKMISLAHTMQETDNAIINPHGTTIATRFNPPPSYIRMKADSSSFAFYLRHLPLHPTGSKVKYYNKKEKNDYAYVAVVNMDIGNKDLQQCADAVMRLRGEYFYQQKKYDSLSFMLTNGFKADYTKWIKGNRIEVKDNKTRWVKATAASNSYSDFRNFMEMVFTYAGTRSLSKTLHYKSIKDLAIGDVFIVGGSPGHAEIVVDAASNKKGEKIIMLAQSYMPAQETQVLRNLNNNNISPWYKAGDTKDIITPQWTFTSDQLKTW